MRQEQIENEQKIIVVDKQKWLDMHAWLTRQSGETCNPGISCEDWLKYNRRVTKARSDLDQHLNSLADSHQALTAKVATSQIEMMSCYNQMRLVPSP